MYNITISHLSLLQRTVKRFDEGGPKESHDKICDATLFMVDFIEESRHTAIEDMGRAFHDGVKQV